MKKENVFTAMWSNIRDFAEEWLYPAYSLRHFFFRRYDIVKMPQLKRTCFYETNVRMYYAVMELVKEFYEKSGWENFTWYDETDEDGNITCNAIRYGTDSETCLFPEYKGKYVIDIVKEIYDWHTQGMERLEKAMEYASSPKINACRSAMMQNLRQIKKECRQHPSLSEKKLVKECFDNYNLEWDLLDRYLEGDRKNVMDKEFMKKIPERIRQEIKDNMQKYLHLAIEVRECLWT